MAPINVILLACGSFNPVTNMHLRIFEVARDHLHRLGQYNVVGGLISPVHDAYGKKDLEAATHRLNMLKLAVQSSDWIKLTDWECKQETWIRTKNVLQYHQNQINALLHRHRNNSSSIEKINEDEVVNWIPNNVYNILSEPVQIKLLCGADLLESFGTPGLWADEDIESIVGEHGLVVISRCNSNPAEFIYNSDVLTKYLTNIVIATEWIINEVSSTKIRRALRRSESVKYLLPDRIIDYIHKNRLYGTKHTKYLKPLEYNSNFLTPSPSDITMESSPSPTNCMYICNNSLFAKNSIDTVDKAVIKTNLINGSRLPGQAVKVIMQDNGSHKIVDDCELNKKNKKEVRSEDRNNSLKHSKSCTNFDEMSQKGGSMIKSKSNLKECKSCDEQLIKFIFTKHGIQVISDVETIV